MDHAVLWVGTYPPDGPGSTSDAGEGVWRVTLDRRTGELQGTLVARSPSPSYLAAAPDGRTLYAAGETTAGTVTTFAVDDGALTQVARVTSGGDWPCHLLVHPSGRTLYVSNYESGTLGVVPLDERGLPVGTGPDQLLPGSGSGPREDRQESSHVHSSLLLDDTLLVADLGTDELRRYRVRADGSLEAEGLAHRFPPGTGPRHMTPGPGGHLYVVGELTATVHLLAWDPDDRVAREVMAVPACDSPVVSGVHDYPAHPVLAGGELVVGVRGPDVVARFHVSGDGSRLEHRQDAAVGGAWPRHLAVVGDPATPTGAWVVVAVQNSGLVTTVRWVDGALATEVTGRVEVPHPACVLPA